MMKVGKAAPAIKLKDQNGQVVSLKDFRDKKHIVLYFYPKAMTPGCTTQACGLRDYKKELQKAGAIAIGISPDSVERLKRFEDKQGLNFQLLSDEDHNIANKYGVWALKKMMGKEYMGIVRTTFIIGKDGKVKHIMDKVKTKTHHDDVLEILNEL
jgi:thioredoxin-dependent peroxiredoxin